MGIWIGLIATLMLTGAGLLSTLYAWKYEVEVSISLEAGHFSPLTLQ